MSLRLSDIALFIHQRPIKAEHMADWVANAAESATNREIEAFSVEMARLSKIPHMAKYLDEVYAAVLKIPAFKARFLGGLSNPTFVEGTENG